MNLELAVSIKKAYPHIQIVGEVKTRSPFGYVNLSPMDRRDMVRALDDCPAIDIISIHTNPFWNGSWNWLEEARGLTMKPILAKDFHDTMMDVEHAFGFGADYCLTVGWWPGDERCWHEVESTPELLQTRAPRIVVNARNPRTGDIRQSFSDMATTIEMYKALNPKSWVCQASMIKRVEDVCPHANAVLIGEGLWL